MEITIKSLNNLDWIDWIVKIAPVIIGVFSVIATLIFIYVTVKLNNNAKKEKRRDAIARYFEIFISEEFHTVRGLAWRAMEKWYLEENFRESIYEYPKDASKIFAFYTLPESNQREISAVYRMIEFLSLVESSGADEEILIQCGFYYDWWRIFLLDWCDHVEAQYNEGVEKFVEIKVKEQEEQTKNSPIADSWKYRVKLFGKSFNGQALIRKEVEDKIKKQFQLSSPVTQFRELDKRLIKNSVFHEPDRRWHLIYHPLSEDALKANGLKDAYKQRKRQNPKHSSVTANIGLRESEVVAEVDGRTVHSHRFSVGTQTFNKAVIEYFRQDLNLIISERFAEAITVAIGNAFPEDDKLSMDVRGRDITTGDTRIVTIKEAEISRAISKEVEEIIGEVEIAIGHIPTREAEEMSAYCSVVLQSKGAYLRGLDKLINTETKLSVIVADVAP